MKTTLLLDPIRKEPRYHAIDYSSLGLHDSPLKASMATVAGRRPRDRREPEPKVSIDLVPNYIVRITDCIPSPSGPSVNRT